MAGCHPCCPTDTRHRAASQANECTRASGGSCRTHASGAGTQDYFGGVRGRSSGSHNGTRGGLAVISEETYRWRAPLEVASCSCRAPCAGWALCSPMVSLLPRAALWSTIEFLPREAMLSLLFTWATIIASRDNFSVSAYFCTSLPALYSTKHKVRKPPHILCSLLWRRRAVNEPRSSATTYHCCEPTHRPARLLAMLGVSTSFRLIDGD